MTLNTGIAQVLDTTFFQNVVSGKNNAVSGQYGLGGGIAFFGSANSSALIGFCTLYGNTSNAGGGGIWIDPTSRGLVTLSNSIIAANSAPDGPDIAELVISDGYNLFTNIARAEGLQATTDKQVALSSLKLDPTLSNNGGPTQTLKLLLGSVAIGAVPQQACTITITDALHHVETITTDQRGNSRLKGALHVCDIGAYESSA